VDPSPWIALIEALFFGLACAVAGYAVGRLRAQRIMLAISVRPREVPPPWDEAVRSATPSVN
jgi:F0F1-type ATP synthase membrane subunit c/vacuolar-type H+-ATPase subunit K